MVVGAAKFSEHATRIVLGSKMLGVRLLKRTHLQMCISRGSATGLGKGGIVHLYDTRESKSNEQAVHSLGQKIFKILYRIGPVLRSVDLSGLGSRLVIWSTII